jgi:hypothetical protein
MLYLVLLTTLLTSTAFATGLVNRYQYLSTDVMPQGVWTFGVSKGQSLEGGNGSFSSGGQKISNEQYFSKDITYSNLLDEIKDPLEQDLARSAFQVYGQQENEYAGTVVNDVDVSQKSEAYILGRGFGEKSSLFIIFPIVTINTRFESTFQHSPSLLSLTEKLRSEGQYNQAQEILDKSQNALRKRLDENGYNSSYPREFTTLANIHLNHRYAAWKTTRARLSADSTLVVPAGKKFDEDDFLYYKVREEQFSFRQNVTGNLRLSPRFSFLTSTYYHKRFPFEQGRRIPRNSASPLSDDIDKNTKIKFGDTYGGSLQLNLSPSDAYLFYLGQSFEAKVKDSVSGSKFQSYRYKYMEQDTAQQLGLAYIGVAMNTVQSFIANNFPIPVDVNLQYSISDFGKNVFNNQAVTMNLMVFYK